jgi:catechol 2,3-dioxygenase-like lactoylglutathione lyase family enzyme
VNFQSLVINVSNLDRSIDFYCDVFAFTLLSRRDQLAAISAPGSEHPQVIVLRAFGTSGRGGGARHVGIRALVLEVDSVNELDEIERALEQRQSLARRLTDNTNWKAVVGYDPDRISLVAGASLGTGPITHESWADLDESLYGLGE